MIPCWLAETSPQDAGTVALVMCAPAPLWGHRYLVPNAPLPDGSPANVGPRNVALLGYFIHLNSGTDNIFVVSTAFYNALPEAVNPCPTSHVDDLLNGILAAARIRREPRACVMGVQFASLLMWTTMRRSPDAPRRCAN